MTPETSIPARGAQKSRPNTAPGSTDRGTGARRPHGRPEAVRWGQGKDCPHRPEWHCEDHGECRGCECGCDTVNPELDLTSAHWLKFNDKREITGCQCGFAADMDSDCGWGDSVVAHLFEVAAEAARPVHTRQNAASLRAIAEHRLEHSTDALDHARAEGIAEAAERLERGLEDEGETDGDS